MIVQLFTRGESVQQHLMAPLAESRLAYLYHCAEPGARPDTLRRIAIAQLAAARNVAFGGACPALHDHLCIDSTEDADLHITPDNRIFADDGIGPFLPRREQCPP